MSVYNLGILDFETTGFGKASRPVEAAVSIFTWDPQRLIATYKGTTSQLCAPGVKINRGAMAVHHITPEMLTGAKPWEEVKKELDELDRGPNIDFWVAHNAPTERTYIQTTKPWICTLKVARSLYPDASEHKLQYLRYWTGIYKTMDPKLTDPPHRAGPDTYICGFLLLHMLNQQTLTIEDMLRISAYGPNNEPGSDDVSRKIDRMPFGKHKGQLIGDVPKSYLEWGVGNFTGDIQAVFREELKKRNTV